ncbi:MAG: hypothetical protein JSS66_15305 [Armatimonadetes bacterium]|nr:hypothetical protein [Armatimonadota bacterium]
MPPSAIVLGFIRNLLLQLGICVFLQMPPTRAILLAVLEALLLTWAYECRGLQRLGLSFSAKSDSAEPKEHSAKHKEH